MKLTRRRLNSAVEERIITAKQADALYRHFSQFSASEPTFSFTHMLYYLGGLIAIGAMSLFMTLGWESFGGVGILIIALVYAVISLLLCHRFTEKGYVIPAGICATFVVVLTPLAIYGFQQALDIWPGGSPYREYHRYINWHWLYMELGTLVVGVVLARYYRFPFLLMPIAVTLWYMSMDIAVMLAPEWANFELRAMVSLYFGLLIVVAAFMVDIYSQRQGDYAFWLYLFGVLAFWGGLTAQESDSEFAKFLYLCVNLGMVGIGIIVTRRVFVVFGAIGVSLYLGHLAWDVFANSWLFPIILSIIGFAIIYVGILWQRYEQTLTQKMRAKLPITIRQFLENNSL